MYVICFFTSTFCVYFRIRLAALRYNENCKREPVTGKMRVEYVKYKGGKGKARVVRPQTTYGNFRDSYV